MKVTSPIFLQQASNVTPFAGVKMLFNIADPEITSITGTDIVVTSIKNGVKTTQTYASLDGAEVSISADKNTWISITGNITGLEHEDNYVTKIVAKNTTALTELDCSSCNSLTSLDLSNNTALTELSCSDCYTLISLDLSNTTALTELSCSSCYSLTSLDLSNNTALTSLNCYNCPGLTALDLSKNTALTYLNCGGCVALDSIKYAAENEGVAESVADLITANEALDGTVYTDSEGEYYSTIADAATAAGWTIAQL